MYIAFLDTRLCELAVFPQTADVACGRNEDAVNVLCEGQVESSTNSLTRQQLAMHAWAKFAGCQHTQHMLSALLHILMQYRGRIDKRRVISVQQLAACRATTFF